MPIVKFAFEDELHGWKLTETSFGPFNLLVGASGVGKTRILKALERVRLAALEGARFAAGCKWTIEVEAAGSKYVWEARTIKTNDVPKKNTSLLEAFAEDNSEIERAHFAEEKIWIQDGHQLVTRDANRFLLQGKDLPKIKNTESAIGLLGDVKEINPLYEAMYRIYASRTEELGTAPSETESEVATMLDYRVRSLDDLRNVTSVSVFAKAWVLQHKFPKNFADIVDSYKEIFDHVEDVQVGPFSKFEERGYDDPPVSSGRYQLTIAIRERGVEGWLTHRRVSAGMLRTLVHLLELALAPAGTVVLIDEFENSLGVNCLPQVADHILGRAGELQFIITSHHPYVINNVPASMWRVVTREGSTVRVLGLEDLPALATASAHKRFTILMNLPEFEHGIR
ncbi:MAG: ATP-binding protein [Thermoanaerobaculia bacterium]|nr:ATP-binding protein [Thermoanaerobaculia bacterium]